MKKGLSITLFIVLVLALAFSVAQAQDNRGTIQGVVYQDVNGDGKCVNTGVEGEGPAENINVEFVSSDEKTIITLYTDMYGKYGLFAAGHSYWRITAKPNADWVVTSQNPLYAPLDDDNRVVTDVNFCVQKANAVTTFGSAAVILPQSGAAHSNLMTIVSVLGVALVLVGLVLEWRRRQA
ncbi:MAG: hypothetical protein H6667_15565 [Ardenticatenaceae bacterium]|nr:hypothetical protein [Ardenticatenaceae bacterium]MCB9446077.1 hypothetical protein [Ardenticatenaceae bacterium]